jgi:hypothetical protein
MQSHAMVDYIPQLRAAIKNPWITLQHSMLSTVEWPEIFAVPVDSLVLKAEEL